MGVQSTGKPRFSKDGIRHIRSKSSKGSVGASLAEAEASTPGAVPAVIFLLVVIAVFGYGFGKTVGEDVWKWSERKILSVNAQEFTEGCLTVLSNGVKEAGEDQLSEEHLKKFAATAVRVRHVARETICL
jgi:hypothetical protein